MTAITPTVDPEARARASWAGRLAQLVSRGVSEEDPRVIECRAGLAYHRIRQSIESDANQLSAAGADRLVSQIRQAVTR